MEDRNIEHHTFDWRGITVTVTYEALWLGSCGGKYDAAHIAVESVKPERAQLPITETGYRSHFTTIEKVDEWGGPVAFVVAWLDDEAKSPVWKKHEQLSRQLTLF